MPALNRRRAITLMACAVAAPAWAQDAAPGPNAIAAELADMLAAYYFDIDYAEQYARMLRQRVADGAYAAAAVDEAFAQRLTEDLAAVRLDRHLRVRVEQRQAGGSQHAAAPASAIEQATTLADGVRLLRLRAFVESDTRALEGFMRGSVGARAIVFDCRAHRGGRFTPMDAVLQPLFDAPRRLMTMDQRLAAVEQLGDLFEPTDSLRRVGGAPGFMRYEHWITPPGGRPDLSQIPVICVTSSRTFSAAEHMLFALKNARRALIVGEPTAGGGHFGSRMPLGGGALSVFCPIGRSFDPVTGAEWDANGVQPDVACPADEALERALALV